MSTEYGAIASAAIIGARGRMGVMLGERLRAAGVEVGELDQPLTDADLDRELPGRDIVILAVPASAMRSVAERAARRMRAPQILADIGSVKVEPMADMRRAYDGPVVGTHPLFGPTPGPEENRVAVVADGDDGAARAVCELSIRLGMEPFLTTAEAHDRAVGQIQGLNFVTTIAYLATLADQPEIEAFLTPSFRRRLDAAESMVTRDAELFAGLFEANPFGQDAVRRFRNFLHVAAGGDVDLLVERARWWWRPPGAK